MFTLAVRSLDGSLQCADVGPDTTVASLRAELGQALALPAFHELKLFHGTQELVDGAPVVIEVQAVKTVSHAKIIKLVKMMAKCYVPVESDLPVRQCRSALALLGEQTDLPRALCEQLLALLPNQEQLSYSGFQEDLAAALGQACGDPTPYIQPLLTMQRDCCADVALAAIVRRLGAASLRAHAAEIASKTARLLREILHWQKCFISDRSLVDACFLVAEYGNRSHKDLLTRIVVLDWNSDEVKRAAAAALERIASRQGARADDAPQEVRSSLAAPCGAGLVGAEVLQDDEQHVKMMIALRMDEAEVLERESADVAEAILRSKGDAAGAKGLRDENCASFDSRIDDDDSALKEVENMDVDDEGAAPKKGGSMAASSNDGPSLSSQLSGPSSGLTEVLPGQASLCAITPHLIDGHLPSLGTVAHGVGCTACRRKARGKECKYGVACIHCHGPHDAAEAKNPGGSLRQRSIKRTDAQSWFRPPTPDPFDEF